MPSSLVLMQALSIPALILEKHCGKPHFLLFPDVCSHTAPTFSY